MLKKLWLFAFLLFAIPAFAGIPTTNGTLTNPAANALLADSGTFVDGHHEVQFIVSSNVAAVVFFEHRNAANDANIFSQAILIPANGTVNIKIDKFVTVTSGERFRLRLNAGVTGTMHGSINVD